MLPLVLAQLLIQFQQPIITEQADISATNSIINDTVAIQINRTIRSISANVNDLQRNSGENFMKDSFSTPDYYGKLFFLIKFV